MTKKNNNILRVTLIILGIVSLIGGIVLSCGALIDNVADNAVAITKQVEKSEACMDMNIRQDKDVVEIKSDLRYLKKDVGDIKGDMKQQTTILQDVLREVRK